MPPSSPCAELEQLYGVESEWRDALSYVNAGEVEAAAAAVERAGAALAALPSATELRVRLDDEQLTAFAARTERLFALHAQLLKRSDEQIESLRGELAGIGRSRATLAAYGAHVPARDRSCDALA
ncbi:MAG: hypothetical protein ACKVXR_16800 [Planctomycetota bacterium]